MKCKSCQSEINPQWKFAITNNVCPFCGLQILDEQIKESFSTMSLLIDELLETDNEDQLQDWLYTNYSYVKVGSNYFNENLPKEQGKFKRTVKESDDEDDEEEVEDYEDDEQEEDGKVVSKMSQKKANTFFERAGVKKVVSKGKLSAKQLVSRIQSENASFAQVNDGGFLTKEMLEGADPDALAEYQQALGNSSTISSSIDQSGSSYDDEEDIPPAVLAMAGLKGKNKSSDYNEADMAKLQNQLAKAKAARSALNSGRGSFTRAG